jgi:hypothetical protein
VGVVMWGRATSVLYGLVVELAPGLRPLDVFGPYVLSFMSDAGGPGARSAPAAAPASETKAAAGDAGERL